MTKNPQTRYTLWHNHRNENTQQINGNKNVILFTFFVVEQPVADLENFGGGGF